MKKNQQSIFCAINASNKELYRVIKDNFQEVRPIYPLIEFVIERLSTTTDLANMGHNWDAEIVYRSALECLVKLIFISSVDGEEREKRLKEYWEDLREISMLKQSEQAKKNLTIYKGNESVRLTFAPIVLSEAEEMALRAKWPRAERKKLEQKWSFSEIILSIANDYRGSQAIEFLGLAHNYRYASHVSHADETGVLIIAEREHRPLEEKEIADFAHYIKHLSDTFYFSLALAIHVLYFVKKRLLFH